MQIWNVLPILLLVAGCVATPTPAQSLSTSVPAAEAQAASPSVVPSTDQATSAPATQPPAQAASSTATAAFPHFSSTPLVLTITAPADQSIVHQPSVQVEGSVSTDAVLTINNDIHILSAGSFTETVALDEGPNAIQIAASNMSGEEIDKVLTVVYQP